MTHIWFTISENILNIFFNMFLSECLLKLLFFYQSCYNRWTYSGLGRGGRVGVKGGEKSIQVYQSLATGEKGVTIMNYITHNL